MSESSLEAYIRTVADYFKQVSSNQGPISYRLLKEYGQSFPISIGKSPLAGKGKMKQCFMNSYRLMDGLGLTYCEGFATSAALGIALEHAWLINESGFVVDPTWKDGREYFGVAFDTQGVYELTNLTGVYGLLGSTYLMKKSPEDCYNLLVSCMKEEFKHRKDTK